MAKKLYTEAGGVSHKVKKLYTEVGGVSHKVKKLYAEVGGYSKLVYNSFTPFTYDFSLYYYQGISLADYCELSSWYAGYRADGTLGMDIVCWNATSYSHCAPAARITINFIDPAALVGKTIVVTYTQDFDTDVDDNELWWHYIKNNGIWTGGSLNGAFDGPGLKFRHKVEAGTTSLYMEMFVGNDGTHGAHITITSITVDGEEVLR
jgi:hypothetical protein